LLVWSFNLHQKQNSVTASLLFEALPYLECNRFPFVGLLGVWWLCSSKRNNFLNFCRFACLVCNKFPFVPLNVWSFNLHQKQNSVTASLSFAVLPCLQVQ